MKHFVVNPYNSLDHRSTRKPCHKDTSKPRGNLGIGSKPTSPHTFQDVKLQAPPMDGGWVYFSRIGFAHFVKKSSCCVPVHKWVASRNYLRDSSLFLINGCYLQLDWPSIADWAYASIFAVAVEDAGRRRVQKMRRQSRAHRRGAPPPAAEPNPFPPAVARVFHIG